MILLINTYRTPTVLTIRYDYKKGGYSWGGYGTFGAIDIWEEQDDSEDEEVSTVIGLSGTDFFRNS